MPLNLFTKSQTVRLCAQWGYRVESLPTSQSDYRDFTIPERMRVTGDNTARVQFGPKNGAGHRLYKITFICK